MPLDASVYPVGHCRPRLTSTIDDEALIGVLPGGAKTYVTMQAPSLFMLTPLKVR